MDIKEIIQSGTEYTGNNRNIPPMVVAAGNPCKVIRKVTAEDKIPVEKQMF